MASPTSTRCTFDPPCESDYDCVGHPYDPDCGSRCWQVKLCPEHSRLEELKAKYERLEKLLELYGSPRAKDLHLNTGRSSEVSELTAKIAELEIELELSADEIRIAALDRADYDRVVHQNQKLREACEAAKESFPLECNCHNDYRTREAILGYRFKDPDCRYCDAEDVIKQLKEAIGTKD